MKSSKFFGILIAGVAVLVLGGAPLRVGAVEEPTGGAVGEPSGETIGEVSVLEFGVTVSGSLEAGDAQLGADGSFFDTYTFEGREGQRVQIRMLSDRLDSYLILLDPTGRSLIQDDDSAGNLDAQIVYTLPTDGRYTIYANAYSSVQQGAYRLELQEADASAPTVVAGTTSTPRYFCDESGSNPVTRARRKDGLVGPLLEWTADRALPDHPALERCRRVAYNLETVHTRLGRNFAITTGRLQNQSVVCAGTAPGICDPEGLILTATSRDDARQLAIQLGTAINALRSAPPDPSIPPADQPTDDLTPLVVAPQFTFRDILAYSNCLEDVIQLYQNPQRLKRSGRRSDCLADIFSRYTSGISRSQALEIITAADRYATASGRDTLLYPPRGQRVRIQELFGFTYGIDQR